MRLDIAHAPSWHCSDSLQTNQTCFSQNGICLVGKCKSSPRHVGILSTVTELLRRVTFAAIEGIIDVSSKQALVVERGGVGIGVT